MNRKIYADKNSKCFCESYRDGYIEYVEVVYEKAIGLVIDLEEKVSLCDLLTIKIGNGVAYLISKGTSVEVMEIRGKYIFPLIDIGSTVDKGSRVCYVITKKYEVRTVRSISKGFVFYIGETFFNKDRVLYMVIVGEDSVTRLTRSC